jgi:hypothetical protein
MVRTSARRGLRPDSKKAGMRTAMIPAVNDLSTLLVCLLNAKRPAENQSDLRQPFGFDTRALQENLPFRHRSSMVFPLAHYCLVYHRPAPEVKAFEAMLKACAAVFCRNWSILADQPKADGS